MTNTLQIDKILPSFLYEDIEYISKYTELPNEKNYPCEFSLGTISI